MWLRRRRLRTFLVDSDGDEEMAVVPSDDSPEEEAVPLEERVAHKRMIPLCHPDFLRQVPLVAIAEGKIVGTMRMAKVPLTKNARILVEVADAFQKQGLGKYLVEQGLKIAQAEQVEKVSMKFFEDNAAMTKLTTAFGFEMAAKDGVVTATKAF